MIKYRLALLVTGICLLSLWAFACGRQTSPSTPLNPKQPMTVVPTVTMEPPARQTSLPTLLSSVSSDGRHMWITSPIVPDIDLKKWTRNGFEEVLSIAYGKGIWVATLIKKAGMVQDVNIFPSISDQGLTSLVDKGNYITALAWGDNMWLVIHSQTSDISAQKLIITSEIPYEEIASAQKEGYWITNIAFGENKWIVILSKSSQIIAQKVEQVDELGPNDTYTLNIDKYLLTSAAYGNGQWFIAKSLFADVDTQVVYISDHFQKDFLQQSGWFDGFDNIQMFFGDNEWVHVLTK